MLALLLKLKEYKHKVTLHECVDWEYEIFHDYNMYSIDKSKFHCFQFIIQFQGSCFLSFFMFEFTVVYVNLNQACQSSRLMILNWITKVHSKYKKHGNEMQN